LKVQYLHLGALFVLVVPSFSPPLLYICVLQFFFVSGPSVLRAKKLCPFSFLMAIKLCFFLIWPCCYYYHANFPFYVYFVWIFANDKKAWGRIPSNHPTNIAMTAIGVQPWHTWQQFPFKCQNLKSRVTYEDQRFSLHESGRVNRGGTTKVDFNFHLFPSF